MFSIIIPVKGTEPNLWKLLVYLHLYLSQHEYEVVVVLSDKDKTRETPNIPIYENVRVRFAVSYGDSLERAILTGFSVAQGNKIIVMDADGSHAPEHVASMIALLDSHEMVVASRFASGGRYVTTLSRKIVSHIFNTYAQLLGSTLTDPMSGYFGIQAQLLQKMTFKPYKWKTALEISNKLRPSTIEVPYTFHNRASGKSHSSWKIGIKILWDVMEGAL